MTSTLEFYNNNSDDYISKTMNINMSYEQNLFLSALPDNIEASNIKILDVGAGSGRDSKFFKELGFNVVALEPALSLAENIKKTVGCEVLPITVQELTHDFEFDAIFASASLLHIPKDEMPLVLEKIKKALKPEGIFFMLLKEGLGEEIDKNGRYYSYYQEDELQELLHENGFNDTIILKKQGKLDNDVTWLTSVSMSETPNLELKKKLKIS